MSDLERLIRFAAVGKELSFTRAAKRLHVDQPWLSRQIQQLEAQMGFPLFVRSTRKVMLTREGRALMPYARALGSAADEAHEAAQNLSRMRRSAIVLGVSPYNFWLPGRRILLDRFRAQSPSTTVEVVSNYSARLLSKLHKRAIDVAIVPVPYDADNNALESLILHRSRPSLLIPAEDSLAACESVEIADLAGKRIAVTNPKLNSAVFEQNFGPFFDAGAEPVIVAEGKQAISFYAKEQRLIMIALSWPDSEPAMPTEFVHVELSGDVHSIEYALVRQRESKRVLLNRFWSLARKVSHELLESEAAD